MKNQYKNLNEPLCLCCYVIPFTIDLRRLEPWYVNWNKNNLQKKLICDFLRRALYADFRVKLTVLPAVKDERTRGAMSIVGVWALMMII